jgi:ABC-type Fe3+-hydroxamate transport system substrate-binding protein
MTLHTSVDQMGTLVQLSAPPQRIVSLVPSQTELLFDLGLGNQIVGVTKFCVHPDAALKTKTIIGGTKKFDLDRIKALKPDLAIGNKEENYPEGIEAIREICPVWMSDVITLPDAYAMVETVSSLTGKKEEGMKILKEITDSFASLKPAKPRRVLYLMWYDPWMVAASNTFIHSLIECAGWINVSHAHSRYPTVSGEDIQLLNPEVVLLSSEPFPFGPKHAAEIRHLLPDADIRLVDGEFFSWYGSRLRLTPNYLQALNI